MNIKIEIVNAFTDGETGGNPAGIVFDADKLTSDQKLKIAKSVGHSETAFVSKSDIATFKLEFFTPEKQIAHCGHATIATFSRMKQLGMVTDGRMSKETIDGVREIIIEGDMAYMEQKAPIYTDVNRDCTLFEKVLDSLGVTRITDYYEASVVNTGNSFLLVPLESAETVKSLTPDMHLVKRISDELDLIGYYVFSTDTKVQGRHAGARMFAPRYGIDEESATGMAAGPLACYLFDRMNIKDTKILIEQGRLMKTPSPSIIEVNLNCDSNGIKGLMAGGRGQSIGVSEIEI